mmetsp:Transcript_17451/g.38704  ORF Transcript_17451/g.38704 Transcript_17451/m.38704 type:complete len:584 (+) Transcript_17451:166-1917(+)
MKGCAYVPEVEELKAVAARLRDGRSDPRCSVTRKENLAITMAYFSVGMVSSLIQTPLNVYLVKTMNAEPSMQNTIAILQTLPWSMKLVFGFISDTFPICGMQRKPYLAIGAVAYSLSFITYALIATDSLALLSACVFMGTLGLIQMDVMADTMCVQRSKFEKDEQRGQMQATFYSVRFLGGLLGAILGACVCNQDTWGWGLTFHQVAFCMGLIPFLIVIPWLPSLKERFRVSPMFLQMLSRRNSDVMTRSRHDSHSDNTGSALELGGYEPTERSPLQGTRSPGRSYRTQQAQVMAMQAQMNRRSGSDTGSEEVDMEDEEPLQPSPVMLQLAEIWSTVQLKSVWKPMTFVFTYNLLQIPNVAWQSYLQLTLHFPAWILGLTVILGSFMTFAGILAYKNFFFKSSWRSIYVGTMCLTTFFSLMQLVLIFQLNTKIGVHNYFFSLGDDVITAYIAGIQFLPVCIMYMRLCPDGAEGTSYSMLTTFGNIALVCASNLGILLAGFFDVSNAALRSGDVSGIWKLSLLTSALALLPLLWLHLLPNSPEEQDALAKSQERSKLAGTVFLSVLVGSLVWTSTSAVLNVLAA